MNQVNLRGRLTTDPQMNYSGDGASVASFTLAVPNRFAKRDDAGNYPADFIRVAAFGKDADAINAYAIKGTEILLTGRFKSGSYEKDNVKHFTTEVQISYFEFVSGTKPKQQSDDEKGSKKK